MSYNRTCPCEDCQNVDICKYTDIAYDLFSSGKDNYSTVIEESEFSAIPLQMYLMCDAFVGVR